MMEYLKRTLPSLNLVRTIVPNRGLFTNLNRMTNGDDPDETAYYETSNQNLHCWQNLWFGLKG